MSRGTADPDAGRTRSDRDESRRQSGALRRANLTLILVGGSFTIASQFPLSLAVRVAGAAAGVLALLVVWRVEYRPAVPNGSRLSRVQRVSVALCAAAAATALGLLLLGGGSPPHTEVPQHAAGLVVMQPDGGLLVGAPGSADGVPGVAVLRFRTNGSLDPGFGVDGIAFHRVGVGAATLDSILSLPDGIVLAGTETRSDGSRAAYVGRLGPDGRAKRRVFFSAGVDPKSRALVVAQSPARLLLGATSQLSADNTIRTDGGGFRTTNTFGLVRLQMNGGLDRAYGTHGYAVGPISCGRVVGFDCHPLRGLMLRADGGVIVVSTFVSSLDRRGRRSRESMGLVFGSPRQGWSTLATDDAGHVLVGGSQTAGTYGESGFQVARLSPSLEFDEAFGAHGTTTLPLSSDRAEVGGLAPLRDGTLLVAGRSPTYRQDAVTVVRLTADGDVDPSFGRGGRVRLRLLDFGEPLQRQVSTGLTVDRAGGILVVEMLAPDHGATTGSAVAVARLDADGTLDRTFGRRGVATTRLDFRGTQILRRGDEFLGGMHRARVTEIKGRFGFAPLGVTCSTTGVPSVTCWADSVGGAPLTAYLDPDSPPRFARVGTPSGLPGRRPYRMDLGETAWIRTSSGAVYCTALLTRFVCANAYGHGFGLDAADHGGW